MSFTDGTMFKMIACLVICAGCVAMSGVFSAAETGIYCLSRLRLSLAVHRGDPRALILQNLIRDRSDLLATTLFGTNVANYVAPLCLTYLFLVTATSDISEHQAGARAEFYTTVILTPIIFILGEIVPKNLFQRHADSLMLRVARLLALARQLFHLTGLIVLQRMLATIFIRRTAAADPTAVLGSRLQMYQLLHEGAAEGNLTRTQTTMLESVHKLRDVPVQSVMVPLSRAFLLRADAKREQLDSTLRITRHSRMPVYRDDRTHIIGMVHLLDLIDLPGSNKVEEITRPVVHVSAATTVLDTLSLLQTKRRRMAVVDDTNGRCIGLVTVKDLVEEIVGELTAW